MNYKLDHILIELKDESGGIRLTTQIENWFIPNQTKEELRRISEINYGIVKDHFKNKVGQIVSENDIENVCFNIVLHYFQMYNHWRSMYKRESKRDLTFLKKDFEHPYTASHIVDYFKKMYPNNYSDKCQLILEMTKEQFEEYALNKEQFDNR